MSCWRLVCVVGVFFCCCCSQLLVVFVSVLLSSPASRCHFCIVHGGGGVPPHGCFLWLHSLVVFVVVVVSSSLSCMMHFSCWRRRPFSWLILSALAPHCRCQHRRRLVVVAVLSLLATASLLVADSVDFCASLPLLS